MRGWAWLLAPLLVWTAHFFGLYAIAELAGATMASRVLALTLSLLCLGANALILWRARRRQIDKFDEWRRAVVSVGAVVVMVAILWQSLPALL